MRMQEAEERVFTSVSNLKAGAGGADNDDEMEDTHSQALLRSECLSPSYCPCILTNLEGCAMWEVSYFVQTGSAIAVGMMEHVLEALLSDWADGGLK